MVLITIFVAEVVFVILLFTISSKVGSKPTTNEKVQGILQWWIQSGFRGFQIETKLFHFHGIFKKNGIKSVKRTPTLLYVWTPFPEILDPPLFWYLLHKGKCRIQEGRGARGLNHKLYTESSSTPLACVFENRMLLSLLCSTMR